MANPTLSMVVNAFANSDAGRALLSGVDEEATRTSSLIFPDLAALLQLYRYIWRPVRYAHPGWLVLLGFRAHAEWVYGKKPRLDQALNQALQARRGTPLLRGCLTPRQLHFLKLASIIQPTALAVGLLALDCNDYLLLPDYRKVLQKCLSESLIWKLFGLCDGQCPVVYKPEVLVNYAVMLGTAILSRLALNEPVLHAVLILLPPLVRALWPRVPPATLILLDNIPCSLDI